jgi:hypothetical protein
MIAACSMHAGTGSPAFRAFDRGVAEHQRLLEAPFARQLLDRSDEFEEVHAVDHARPELVSA